MVLSAVRSKSKWMMSTIQQALVTGGAGFIGSHLCDALLASGWRVRALDDLSVGTTDNLAADVEFIHGDVRDPAVAAAACRGVTTVYHLAARVTVRDSFEHFRQDAATNVMGTLTMLDAARQAGCGRFVLASSMAVYQEAGEPITEDHPTIPISPYGLSKLTAERYLFHLAGTFGIEPVALRMFNVYGPRQGYSPYVGVIRIFLQHALEGRGASIIGDGEQRRDYVHVADVVQAFMRGGESPAAVGAVFNVGTGVPTTVNQLAALTRQKLGCGAFDHVAAVAGEQRHSVAVIERARARLGYSPAHPLTDGLDDLIAHLRDPGGGR